VKQWGGNVTHLLQLAKKAPVQVFRQTRSSKVLERVRRSRCDGYEKLVLPRQFLKMRGKKAEDVGKGWGSADEVDRGEMKGSNRREGGEEKAEKGERS
jgi:hypothetical protein